MPRICDCGRSTIMPYCDGSHTLTDEEYKERCEEFAEFDEPKPEDNKE